MNFSKGRVHTHILSRNRYMQSLRDRLNKTIADKYLDLFVTDSFESTTTTDTDVSVSSVNALPHLRPSLKPDKIPTVEETLVAVLRDLDNSENNNSPQQAVKVSSKQDVKSIPETVSGNGNTTIASHGKKLKKRFPGYNPSLAARPLKKKSSVKRIFLNQPKPESPVKEKEPEKTLIELKKLELENLITLKKSKAFAKIPISSLRRLATPKKYPGQEEKPIGRKEIRVLFKKRISTSAPPKIVDTEKTLKLKRQKVVTNFNRLIERLDKRRQEATRAPNGEIISYKFPTEVCDLKGLGEDVDEFIKEYVDTHKRDVVKMDSDDLGGLVLMWCLNYIESEGSEKDGYYYQLEYLSYFLYPNTKFSVCPSLVNMHPEQSSSSDLVAETDKSSSVKGRKSSKSRAGYRKCKSTPLKKVTQSSAAAAFILEEGYVDHDLNRRLVADLKKSIDGMDYVPKSLHRRRYMYPDFPRACTLFAKYKLQQLELEEERTGKIIKTIFTHKSDYSDDSSDEDDEVDDDIPKSKPAPLISAKSKKQLLQEELETTNNLNSYWSGTRRAMIPASKPFKGPVKPSAQSNYIRKSFTFEGKDPEYKKPTLDLTIYGVGLPVKHISKPIFDERLLMSQHFTLPKNSNSVANEKEIEENKAKVTAAAAEAAAKQESKAKEPRFMRSTHHTRFVPDPFPREFDVHTSSLKTKSSFKRIYHPVPDHKLSELFDYDFKQIDEPGFVGLETLRKPTKKLLPKLYVRQLKEVNTKMKLLKEKGRLITQFLHHTK